MVHYASLLLACLLGSATASNKQVSDDGTLHCGNFGSGDKSTVSGLERDLSTGSLKDKMFKIPPGECNRVHCDDTTGIYVCNVCVIRGPFFAPTFNPPFFPLSPFPSPSSRFFMQTREKSPDKRLTTHVVGCRMATTRYRSLAQ